MNVREDVLDVTHRFSAVVSKKKVNYSDVVTSLRDIRSVLNIDCDQYGEIFIEAHMPSLIAVYWGILIESGEMVDEALKCLLPLCRNERFCPMIAGELLCRGVHIFCFQSIKRYLRRKAITIYGVELVSLLISTCFAQNSLIFFNEEKQKKVASVLQDMLVQGGLSSFSQLLVEFVKHDIRSRSIYKLLICIQFCLFNSPPDVAFRIVSANNFALLSAILSVVLGYGGKGEDEYRQLDENRETLKLAVQVLFCLIGSNKANVDYVATMLEMEADKKLYEGSLWKMLSYPLQLVDILHIKEIPIAVLETVVQYMEDRVMRLQIVEDRLSSKLMKHKRNVHTVTRIACANETISDLVDLCAYIDGITKDCRKQEQQNIIGKFLQDVLRGKPQAATTGALGEVQDVKQNEESDEFGGRSSPLFDAERNTLCADVSTADVIKMSEDKSREFWMIKEIPKLYNEPKLSSLDMLQTNPLGRPLLKEGFQEPLHDNIDSIAKTKLSPGSPTQYIAPSLEQILVESPEKRLGTPKSRPGSPNMLNKALNPPLNDANGSNDTEKEENFVSPLELLAKSPYLGKYSIDNIQKKKKMQQKIASVQATKTASLKGKSQCKSSKLPKLKAKDLEAERVVRKSKYSEDILLVPLFAEKLFTIDDKPVDCDAPSTHSKCKNIVAKELSHLSYAERLKVMMVEVDMANEKILQRNPTLKHSDIGTENNSEIAGEGVSRSNDNDDVGLMDNGKEKEVKEMSDAEKQSVFREQEALALAAQRSEMKRLEDELLQMRKQQYEAVVTDTSTKFVERLTGGVLYAASIVEKIEKELQQRTQQEQCV